VDDRLFVGKCRAIRVGPQSADALGVVDQFFLGHVLAMEHGPPVGFGFPLMEIEELTGKLAPFAICLRYALQ